MVKAMGSKYLTLNEVRDETGLTAIELRRLIDAGVLRLVHGKRSGHRIARTELRRLDGLVLTWIPPQPPPPAHMTARSNPPRAIEDTLFSGD